jgi:hypothetical protein
LLTGAPLPTALAGARESLDALGSDLADRDLSGDLATAADLLDGFADLVPN